MLSSLALAQAPANDVCAGAEIIPANGSFPVFTSITDLTNATGSSSTGAAAGDPAPSCQSSWSRGVWYAFTPARTATYLLSTCGTVGTTVPDTVLAVFTSSNGCAGPFVQVSTGGCDDNSCQQASGASVTATPLTAGTTYYILLYKNGTGVPSTGQGQVQLSVSEYGPASNDLCSGATPLQLDLPVFTSTATAAADYQLPSAAACFTGLGQTVSTAPGRDAVWSFTAPGSGKYSFRINSVENDTSNVVLYVANTCPSSSGTLAGGACVGAANRTSGTSGVAEEVPCLSMQAGETFYAFADEHTLGVGNQFRIEVNRCLEEVEPNGTVATANPFVCGMTGSVNPANDVDFFELGTPATGYRLFALQDGAASKETDLDLRVTTATGTLEFDDANNDIWFGGLSANVAGTPLTGVPTYLRVSHFSGTASEPYRLYGVIQPPLAQAIPEREPNNSLGNATTGTYTYFSGALAGPAPSTDVDLYSFTANAGDLIFVSLDGDPLRDNTPLNAAVALLDANGRTLMLVNDGGNSSSTTASPSSLTGSSPSSPGEALVWRAEKSGTYFVSVFSGSTTSTTATTGDYLLSISINCRGVLPAPSLSALSRTSGSTLGGTNVTLTGTNFVAPVQVRFGNALATNVTVVSPTEITATSPAGAAGLANVTVSNPDAQRATLTGAFTYVPPPVISNVALNYGPVEGGNTVVITGASFDPNAVVTFDSTVATITAASATSITVVAPAGSAGAVPLKVTNADGQTATATYRWVLPPSITAISPSSGYTAGGTAVTISGNDFISGAIVLIGGNTASVTAITSTSIQATTPAGAAGPADVKVINADNQSGLAPGLFKYVPPPTITLLDPAVGFTTGDTLVTISGQDFLPGATVRFDGLPATEVTFVSSTELTAKTPGHAPGAVAVRVTNPDGQSDLVIDAYNYVPANPAPVISGVTPSVGTTAGGTVVTLHGSNFLEGARVEFAGLPATSVVFVSEGELQAVTPAHAFALVDVTVHNPDNQSVTATGLFRYDHPAPVINSVTPSSAKTSGGQVVTLAGNNFLPGASVTVGGTPATNVTVVNATTVTLTVPAHAGGVFDVVLTNADGKFVTLSQAFTYLPPPSISGITPVHGSTLGGEAFTLNGADFLPGATVSFGGTAATLTAVTPTTIQGITPARAAGLVAISVTNPDGQQATRAGAFTFILPPRVTSLQPNFGPTAGGATIAIIGQSFTSGGSVTIGGTPAQIVSVAANRITVVSPPGPAGTADVVVVNQDGQSFTVPAGFTFIAPPVLSAVDVSSGPARGGTTLTLTGSAFLSGASVKFGQGASVSTTFVSATELRVVTPLTVPGTMDLTVRNPDGQTSTLAAAFTSISAPVIKSLTPDRGYAAGGEQVVLEGDAFQPGATVAFGGVPATTVQFVSTTRLTVVTPAHPAGPAEVEVTNADGQITKRANAYQFVAAPELESVAPASGTTRGGTLLTLLGSGFHPGSRVSVGGKPATAVVYYGPTRLTAVAPANAAGPANVEVLNPDGQVSTLTTGFTYDADAPMIEAVTPAEGPETGGTWVLIGGWGFAPGATVTVGSAQATQVEVISDRAISAKVPAGSVGTANVVVANPDGKRATATGAFKYVAGPTVDAGTPTPDAGTPSPDAGVDPKPEPEPSGCGCRGTSGGFEVMALLALAALFRVRRGRPLIQG